MAKTIIYDFANIHLNTYRIDEAKADIYLSLSWIGVITMSN